MDRDERSEKRMIASYRVVEAREKYARAQRQALAVAEDHWRELQAACRALLEVE